MTSRYFNRLEDADNTKQLNPFSKVRRTLTSVMRESPPLRLSPDD
jgi:hypothetical protein